MSRYSNTDKPKNPAQMFLEWKSKEKTWSYWDKDAEERRTIPFNTPFVVLDILSTAVGYDKPKKVGFWANEVRDTKHKLVIQSKNGVLAEGPWKEVKGAHRSLKFASSVYAFAKINGEPMLVNFKISGCALRPWIEFRQELDGRGVYGDIAVAVKDTVFHDEEISYTSPVFGVAATSLSEETTNICKEMHYELQKYLTGYLQESPQAKAMAQHSEEMQAYEAPPVEDAPAPVPDEDDLPF